MTKEEIKMRFQEIGVIYDEPVTLRSGQVSKFYCDIKKSYGYPDLLTALAQEIGKTAPPEITCIAASGYGGLPLASVVATQVGLKFTAVRSSPKNHGKGGFIDGYVPDAHDQIMIIDDVLTTGSSILETMENLKDTGAKVATAVVVVRRGEPELPIPCSHIFTIGELTNDEE